jgi:HAMP domain-containing protein
MDRVMSDSRGIPRVGHLAQQLQPLYRLGPAYQQETATQRTNGRAIGRAVTEAAMRSSMMTNPNSAGPGRRERAISLEMTFWRIEPLDELVDLAHRCVGKLDGIVPAPAQCCLKVYSVEGGGERYFEVQVNLVGLSTCADSVCYRGPDLFGTVEQAFEALLQHICEQAETTGVRVRARPSQPPPADGEADERLASSGS